MPELLDSADPRRGNRPLIAPSEAEAPNRRREEAASSPLPPPLLLCEKVSKWYGAVLGVNQISLELRPGITGLVGANGAGKSTLMRLITGHIRPDLGRVTVRGFDAWSTEAKRHVGYCPDVDSFYEEMSGRQFVQSMALLCGFTSTQARQRTEKVLELVGMADRASRKLRGYSKGMRQRIKLAQALLNDPALLVLDEPLSGIDPVGRAEMVSLFLDLAGQGKCLFISSHELEELEKLTDHVVIVSRGRIAAVDTIDRIRKRLADHPLTIRLALRRGEMHESTNRQLAGHLMTDFPEVVAVEVQEGKDAEEGVLVIRARNPESFFPRLNRLVLEEWFDLVHLETVDTSTQAVLGYLLGRKG